MKVRQERLFEGLPANLPETELSKLVVACAEKALETGKEILPITENQVESFRQDVEALLQPCDYLIEGRKRSKKPHRNLVDAVQEVLHHNPRYRRRFLLVLKEVPEQKKQRKPYKPWIPTHLGNITMIRRDLLEVDPGSDVFCVITKPSGTSRFFKVRKDALKSARV